MNLPKTDTTTVAGTVYTPSHEADFERIGTYRIRRKMRAEVKAKIVLLVAMEDQARLDLDAARVAHVSNPLPAFRDDILDRAEKHVFWHIARGEKRGLAAPEITDAENAMLTAISALAEAESDEGRDAASEAAHDALSRWKHALEDRAWPVNSPAHDQCIEIDQGEIGALLRCVDSLDYLASADARQRLTREQMLFELAATLFECPHPPAKD